MNLLAYFFKMSLCHSRCMLADIDVMEQFSSSYQTWAFSFNYIKKCLKFTVNAVFIFSSLVCKRPAITTHYKHN